MITMKNFFIAMSALMFVAGSIDAAKAKPKSKNPLASHAGFMAEQQVFFTTLDAAKVAHKNDDDATAKTHLKNANKKLSQLKKLGKGRARSVTVWQKAYNEVDDVVAGRAAAVDAAVEQEIEDGEAGNPVGQEETDEEIARLGGIDWTDEEPVE